jgi:hypothetical protein
MKKISEEKLKELRTIAMKEARLHAELDATYTEFRRVKVAAFEEADVISATPTTERGPGCFYHNHGGGGLNEHILDLETGEIKATKDLFRARPLLPHPPFDGGRGGYMVDDGGIEVVPTSPSSGDETVISLLTSGIVEAIKSGLIKNDALDRAAIDA